MDFSAIAFDMTISVGLMGLEAETQLKFMAMLCLTLNSPWFM